NQISMGLPAQIGAYFAVRSQRMTSCAHVLLRFQQKVERQMSDARLHLVIQDDVAIEELRRKMRFAIGTNEGRIGHPVRREGAGRGARQSGKGGASGTFARNWQSGYHYGRS